MMKRFQLMGVTLFALLAFGVLTAASASAVTFLLAEWLVNGAVVSAELATETTGELLLEDSALKAMVLCSGIFDGWIGPNSLDFISEVLSLEKVTQGGQLVMGTGITCEAQETCAGSPAPLVWAANLPWETEAELMEDEGLIYFVDLLTGAAGKGVGYELECTVLGVKASDECVSLPGFAELTLDSGPVLLGNFSEAFTLLAEAKEGTCTFAGGETGIVEGGGTFSLVGGGELTVSSDGITV
jgi:hypothetical protein